MINVPGVVPIAPYSPAVKANGFIFVSGQLGWNTEHVLAEGIEKQTTLAMKNLGDVLKLAGSDYTKIVKCQIFIKDMNQFDAMNKAYAVFFPVHKPARFCVEVARLPKDALVEIDATAVQ